MKYTKRLKENLTKNYNKSLKFSIISKGFIIGFTFALVSSIAIKLFYNSADELIAIFIGFAASYFLFADTVLHLFKNIKNMSLIKLNINILKDLLIIFFFFIIIYKFIKVNFILVAVGITVTPVSVVMLNIFFPFNIKFDN